MYFYIATAKVVLFFYYIYYVSTNDLIWIKMFVIALNHKINHFSFKKCLIDKCQKITAKLLLKTEIFLPIFFGQSFALPSLFSYNKNLSKSVTRWLPAGV